MTADSPRLPADSMSDPARSIDVTIATPLESALVAQIRDAVPAARIHYEPDLLPPVRYPADHKGDPAFCRDAGDQRRFDSLLDRADVLFGVPGDTPEALAAVVRAHPGVRWIAGTAAGAGEQLRRATLSRKELDRVQVTSTRGVHADQLAEWALFGLLAFTKDLPRLRAIAAEQWWGHFPVRELAGGTVVVVGLGEIGRGVARRCRAMGMHVIGVRRHSGSADADVDDAVTTDQLPGVLPRVDAVVLSLPATPATEGLFSRDMIAALPTHAIVVNVGRGSTLDETALIEALREDRLAGAALDVTATEPLPADSPLWSLRNVLISPHTAALSTKENERIVGQFCANLDRYVAGQPLTNVVDTEHFY